MIYFLYHFMHLFIAFSYLQSKYTLRRGRNKFVRRKFFGVKFGRIYSQSFYGSRRDKNGIILFSFSFCIRVGTLPLNSCMLKSGRNACTCTFRRVAEVPSTASLFIKSFFFKSTASLLISNSSDGSSRYETAPTAKP